MSTCTHTNLTETHVSFLDPGTDFGDDIPMMRRSDARNLFTHQVGQVLLELGNLFLYFPPFNEHVNHSTGDLLISIGNQLKASK